MEVWLLEWDYPYDQEHNLTVWADEQSAYQQGCTEIKRMIDSDFDMDDSDQEEVATQFDEHMAKGTIEGLRLAMNVWNEYQTNFNDEQGQWYDVTDYEVLGSNEPVTKQSASQVAYISSTSGATCRGPCKQYNEYAYADRPDGTHICKQCSTFQHIFGTKKP